MIKKQKKNTVFVVSEYKTLASVEKKIAQIVYGALFFEKMEKISVTIHIVTDASMRRINRKTRKKDTPTNVLSFENKDFFPHPELKSGYKYCGDVFLAPRYIKKKKENIYHLVIHGLLHLLGYDHKEKNDRIVMEAREKEILLSLSSVL